jgi:hypothetical protein
MMGVPRTAELDGLGKHRPVASDASPRALRADSGDFGGVPR